MEFNGQVLRNLEEQVQYLTTYLENSALANEMGIKVLGRVDTVDDIPEGDYEFGDAYMVGTEGNTPYRMVVWTRDAGDGEPGWFDIGYFPTAPDEFSIVLVNGEPVHEWDADTKLDKYTLEDGVTKAYVAYNGSQGMMLISSGATANAIAARTSSGALAGPDPTLDGEYVPKKFADDHYVNKTTSASTYSRVYAIDASGNQVIYDIKDTTGGMVMRVGQGQINSPNPTNDYQLANRGYNDGRYQMKRYLNELRLKFEYSNYEYTILMQWIDDGALTITTFGTSIWQAIREYGVTAYCDSKYDTVQETYSYNVGVMLTQSNNYPYSDIGAGLILVESTNLVIDGLDPNRNTDISNVTVVHTKNPL